tara:strand:- start:250 stop:876 length:627 start_codon:yes stop_codon:yes gene_type:complete
MKFLNSNKTLCLSPHPDDAEYSISATVEKCSDTIFEIVCLSNSGKNDKSGAYDRKQECVDYWKGYTNVNVRFADTEYIQDKSFEKWVEYLEQYVSSSKCDTLLVPTAIDSHNDHQYINSLANPALRVSNCSLIEYRTPSTLDGWEPNYFVDVQSLLDKKATQLIKAFVSQRHRIYFQPEHIKAFHTNFQCIKKGMPFTEQFKIIKLYS